jgi:hypothetical protein
MRSFPILFLCASVSVVLVASAATAQDQPVAPTATATATATTAAPSPSPPPTAPPATTTPPVTTAPPPPPPTAATAAPTKHEDDQEPLRLGRLIETESDRAKARRFGGSAVGMVTGGGIIASGALILAVGVQPGNDATFIDIFGVTTMIIGGVQVVSNLVSLFITSPMERMFDAYAPIAIDKDLAPSERVRRGEVLLASMAELERRNRLTEGTTNLVVGVIETGLAIVVAADKDLVFDYNPAANDVWRASFALAFALGAATTLGSAIASMVWERGPAEVAWEHWQATHGNVTVHTEAKNKLQLRPLIAPMPGGGMAGVRLRF